MLEANEMKVLSEIVSNSKIDKIRSQQIKENTSIQTINDWAERRRREWDEHVRRVGSERLTKI